MPSVVDVTIQSQLLDLLEKLRAEMGLTIILISHDLGVVRRICSQIIVLNNGRVVESGPAGLVIAKPTEAYTRELVAAVLRMPALVDVSINKT